MVASYLIRRFDHTGTYPLIVARRRVDLPSKFRQIDFEYLKRGDTISDGATVVSLLPLGALAALMPLLKGSHAIIALGSTSLFSKASSADASERAFAEHLASSEDAVRRDCTALAIHLTILRPTLVYDFANDRNIARMARFIRRFRTLPIGAPANGLRQPIHADDIAKAILAAIGNPEAFGMAFNIAGGEQLSYRLMATRVFAAMDRRPSFLPFSPRGLALIFSVAKTLGLLREAGFAGSVFQRMNQDLIFDVADGLRVLRYDPRPFDLPSHPRPGDLDYRNLVKSASANENFLR